MQVKVVRNVLEENENLAQDVRQQLRQKHQTMVNFMGSPGSGKTKLLEVLVPNLREHALQPAAIVGDITTTCDADRLGVLNIPVAQINTQPFGGACHLGANMVLGGMDSLSSEEADIILLENVGNLVCPAEFDTGSDMNIVVISVTEGEDKPLKYPLMFQTSHLAVISKIDLTEGAGIDLSLLKKNMEEVNGRLQILEVSAKTGLGIQSLAKTLAALHAKQLA